ncbi:clasp N terminal-domain-containing protein [Cyathus striatus]|nr:clasp N terminal-domain-containing protein [Cyathus striatus]
MDLLNSYDFQHELRSIKTKICLQETEETWDAITAGIISLRDACDSTGYTSSLEFAAELRELQRPLINAMFSERTRLSGAAIDLIVTIATLLGTQFEPLLSIFYPSLLHLCSRANKVVATRARTAVLSIIETTQLSSILPHLLHCSKDKATSLRLAVAEGTLACLNCCNPPDLEKNSRIKEIEAIIQSSARDANADVRQAGRRIFEAYKILFPWRIDTFTAPLTPTIRKYLDLKVSAVSSTQKQPKESGIQPKKCSVASTSQSSVKISSNKTNIEPSRVRLPNTTTFRNVKQSTRSNQAPSTKALPVGMSQSTNMGPHHFMKTETSSLISASRLSHPRDRKDGPDIANSRFKNISKMRITNIDTSGPRRIPLPESSEIREDVQLSNGRVGSGNNSSKPDNSLQSLGLSRNGPSRLNRSQIYKSEIHNTDQPALTSSKIRTKAQVPNRELSTHKQNREARSVTQPTLSQLARVRRPVERKAGGTVGTKPLWGRPSTRRDVAKGSPKKSTKLPQKPNTGVGNVIADEPANIPLPTSPILTSEGAMQENSKSNGDLPDAINETCENAVSNPDPILLQTDIAYTPTVVGNEIREVENTENCSPITQELGTPKHNSRQSSFSIADIRTPISALLESIEQGFELTPSSPLSPPQPYLMRGPLVGMTGTLNIPFHLAISEAKARTTMELTEDC